MNDKKSLFKKYFVKILILYLQMFISCVNWITIKFINKYKFVEFLEYWKTRIPNVA